MTKLIHFRGQQFVDCTESRFHIQNIEWADKWLNTPADQLPGVLTHDKCVKEQIKHEVALIDYQRFYA